MDRVNRFNCSTGDRVTGESPKKLTYPTATAQDNGTPRIARQTMSSSSNYSEVAGLTEVPF